MNIEIEDEKLEEEPAEDENEIQAFFSKEAV